MQPVEGDISGEKRNEERGDLWMEIDRPKEREERENLQRARSGQMEPMMACFFFFIIGRGLHPLTHRESRHFG